MDTSRPASLRRLVSCSMLCGSRPTSRCLPGRTGPLRRRGSGRTERLQPGRAAGSRRGPGVEARAGRRGLPDSRGDRTVAEQTESTGSRRGRLESHVKAEPVPVDERYRLAVTEDGVGGLEVVVADELVQSKWPVDAPGHAWRRHEGRYRVVVSAQQPTDGQHGAVVLRPVRRSRQEGQDLASSGVDAKGARSTLEAGPFEVVKQGMDRWSPSPDAQGLMVDIVRSFRRCWLEAVASLSPPGQAPEGSAKR